MAEANQSAKVGKVNVGENMELAAKYSIAAVPTIIVFKGGKPVEKIQGFHEQTELQKILDSHLES